MTDSKIAFLFRSVPQTHVRSVRNENLICICYNSFTVIKCLNYKSPCVLER